MTEQAEKKGFVRAFLDFFILFSGISTASNLSRRLSTPVLGLGMFLVRGETWRSETWRSSAERAKAQ